MKIIFSIILIFSISKAEIFDISIPENDTASYTYADFRIRLNDSIDTLKGIYWFMHHNNGDSRNIVNDTSYQTLADAQDFALLGARIFNMHMHTGIGDAVIAAIDSFAVLSGHQELSYVPFFINGYSWGGQFGYHFSKWIPDRIAGLITQKGGYHDTTNAGPAIEIPILMIVGENDLEYRIDNLTGIFFEHRPLGAKWTLAMEPEAAHTQVSDHLFLNSFFNDVIQARLPLDVNVFDTIQLNTLSDTIGWLGNQNTYRIGSWECYDGIFDSSSWFPSRGIGEYWQNFMTNQPTDTSSCFSYLDSNYVYFNIGIHGLDSTSDFIVTTNNQILIDECRLQLELPEDERQLHVNGYLDFGDGGFNEPWNWHIIPNNWVLAEMSIGTCNVDPAYIESNLDNYVNSVGQLCNWGSFVKNELETDCNDGDELLWNQCYSIEETIELDLSSNNLSGPIPNVIGNFMNLNYLNLSNNQLTDEIPQEIFELPKLKYLLLNDNQLNGELPDIFTQMDSINQLNLTRNNLSGLIPASICSIYSQLELFELGENSLCPPYPSCLTFDDLGYQNNTDCEQVEITNQPTPFRFQINNAYPNPFNPNILIHYEIPEDGNVKIFIYDLIGRRIFNITDEYQLRGKHKIEWNGDGEESGVYFLEITTENNRAVKKLVLLK